MNSRFDGYYEVVFKTRFLEAKGNAFQDLFTEIMSRAYPENFIPCRPWGNIGDRKNDGYLKSERTLFQVYAPNEMRASDAVRKCTADFQGALLYWQEYFDKWVFVHNDIQGLSPDIIKVLLALDNDYPAITVAHWGYSEILERARLLSDTNIREMLGPRPKNEDFGKQAHEMIKAAQELVYSGKLDVALDLLRNALTFTKTHRVTEREVEVLVALAMLSPRRKDTDRDTYFRHAQEKFDHLKSDEARVIYYRLEASIMEERRDFDAAERAYLSALECRTKAEKGEDRLELQHWMVRASFVHFLCNEKRLDEAAAVLKVCDEFVATNQEDENGELLRSVFEAGIHLAIEAGDEADAIRRISELESSASLPQVKERRAEALVDIANRCSQRKAHKAAFAAANAAVRLGRQHSSGPFLSGVLYTEAAVALRAGDYQTALEKAEALIGICNGPDEVTIRQAAHHVVAQVSRQSGDTRRAVDMAKKAVELHQGDVESAAQYKIGLARCLNDNGETEAALQEAKQGWGLLDHEELHPAIAMEFLGPISDFASQLGFEEDVDSAVKSMEDLPEETDDVGADKERYLLRIKANTELRNRLLEVLNETDPRSKANVSDYETLEEANAEVAKPLIEYWSNLRKVGLFDKECVSGAYDFWARGNFERILFNSRSFPRSFNVTLEVRTLADIELAIRMWGLYADVLILLWKGPSEGGYAIIPFPDDYAAPGGWGYMVTLGDVMTPDGAEQDWYPAMGHISTFPEDVIHFLATEAAALIELGRLIIVPATGVGCINPGHGPFEQLLAEAANAVPGLRAQRAQGSLFGEIPYSPDVPLPVLADLAQSEADSLRKLRLLLLRRRQQLGTSEDRSSAVRLLSLEIDDALRDIAGRGKMVLRKKGFHEAKEKVIGATADFKSDRSAMGGDASSSPFASLLMLESLGYGWRVEGTDIPRFPERFEPKKDDLIGAWLAPPSAGWTVPFVQKAD